MVDVEVVVERVKGVLSNKYKSDILDKNVAYELGLSATNLSSMKTRGYVPYYELTIFCKTNNINMNWLFLGLGGVEIVKEGN